MTRTKFITATLVSLVVLDLILTLWGFFLPELWFSFFHNAPHVDPQGLLKRCAGNWLAFFLIQSVALVRWKNFPWLLAMVAGARLGDALTDLTCLTFSSSISIFGIIAFPIAGIGNMVIGLYLIREFIAIQSGKLSVNES